MVRVDTLGDRELVSELLQRHWSAPRVLARGRLFSAQELSALGAWVDDQLVGFLTYVVERGHCQVVTLNSWLPRRGVGTALLRRVESLGFARVWLVTTNDNLPALEFYQKRGYRLVAVHELQRSLKPEIPSCGYHEIPIRQEIEMERV